MDPLEQSFLRSLREDPEDRTTRLVYADWLDEHDDPRGGFLRDEVELVSLSAGGVRWRELQASLGRDALRFDPEWVTDASLSACRLAERWHGIEKHLRPYRRDQQPVMRFAQWEWTVRHLESRFADHFSKLGVGDRFRVPLDYTLFQIVIGSGWYRDDDGDEWLIQSIADVSTISSNWMEDIDRDIIGDSGIALSLCILRADRSSHHLCCDRLHPAFGAICTPHLCEGVWFPSVDHYTILAPSFLDFLRAIPP